MKSPAALAVAVVMTGAAHAEQFDLVCATKLTTEISGRPSSSLDQEMRYSLDTDAKLIRQHGRGEDPFPLTIQPDRFVYQVKGQEWVIDRQSNKITSRYSGSVSTLTLVGDCKKEAYTKP